MDLIIVGAGGHGRCCLGIAREVYDDIVFLYDDLVGKKINDCKVIGCMKDIRVLHGKYSNIFIAIGNNKLREELITQAQEIGFNIVNLPINLGIGGAVQTGYIYEYEHVYDVAVQVDGDGQHDPEFLDTMAVYLIDHNLDMVIGSRFIEKKGFQSSYTRRMGIRFFTGLIKLMTRKTITDPTSGLRMIGRNAMGLFAYDYPRDYPEPESVVAILRRNMRVEEIPVVMKAREGGVSSISLKKSVYYMIKVPLAILIERIRKY